MCGVCALTGVGRLLIQGGPRPHQRLSSYFGAWGGGCGATAIVLYPEEADRLNNTVVVSVFLNPACIWQKCVVGHAVLHVGICMLLTVLVPLLPIAARSLHATRPAFAPRLCVGHDGCAHNVTGAAPYLGTSCRITARKIPDPWDPTSNGGWLLVSSLCPPLTTNLG